MTERTPAEVREWADRLLPTPFDDEQWRVDDGVEIDPEYGPYIARQPHVEDADGFEVALLFTQPSGWEVELIAAAPDLARELLRLADLAEAQAAELDRLRQVGMWFDAIRFALADHEGELPPEPDVTVQAVRNLLKRDAYHEGRHERYLEHIDELSAAIKSWESANVARKEAP